MNIKNILKNINEFLWSCAGVNKDILRQYPNEYAKYAGSGGTILFTALMAVFSGGYAMYFVFNNIIITFLFAIFWGLLIFNLDRFIVNSMYSDGKDTITWRKFKSALPRIIMAIFIGIVVSTPLEMKIFNDRIESQLLKDNIERINAAKNESQDYSAIAELQEERKKLSDERNKLTIELQKAQKDLKEEAEGNALSGIAGHGAIYKDKEIYVQQCQQALNDWDKLHNNRLNYIQKRIDEVSVYVTSFENKVEELREDGFSARYEAFSNLKDENKSLAVVSFMITLMFIFIEVTPTFFKLIMSGGPYDEHVKYDDYKVHIFTQQKTNELNLNYQLSEYENNNTLNNKLKQNSNKIQQKTITYKNNATGKIENDINYKSNNIDEVPYKIESHTSINKVKKHKEKDITFPKSKDGNIIMNFKTKKRLLY